MYQRQGYGTNRAHQPNVGTEKVCYLEVPCDWTEENVYNYGMMCDGFGMGVWKIRVEVEILQMPKRKTNCISGIKLMKIQ